MRGLRLGQVVHTVNPPHFDGVVCKREFKYEGGAIIQVRVRGAGFPYSMYSLEQEWGPLLCPPIDAYRRSFNELIHQRTKEDGLLSPAEEVEWEGTLKDLWQRLTDADREALDKEFSLDAYAAPQAPPR